MTHVQPCPKARKDVQDPSRPKNQHLNKDSLNKNEKVINDNQKSPEPRKSQELTNMN